MSATVRTTATIDGNSVDVHPGQTILDVASAAGIRIPTLCHVPGLEPEGGCRLCMVEVNGSRLQAACHSPLLPGMSISTHTPRLLELRRELLALTVRSLPGPFTARPNGTPFERLLHEYGVSCPNAQASFPTPIDDSHPYLRFDRDKCITCRVCLNTCEQVQGQFVYGIEGRGGHTRLIFGGTDRFADSDCVACGACVDRCPTGAISDIDRRTDTVLADHATDSVCGYCGVGCRVHVSSSNDVVLHINGVPAAAVNHGHLCVKGRYAHAYHHSEERLTTPLLRVAGTNPPQHRPASWDEAIAFAAHRLRAIRDAHGPDALGTMTSSRSTNEAAFLLQKLFRTTIGTNNVDCCARVCHSSTAVALGAMTGTGAATASYADLERTSLIVVAGANPTEAHPVVGARIKQAALRGAALVVIDPREIELARYAAIHLRLWPGTNVAMMNAIAKVIIEESLFESAYVDARCEGFETLRAALANQPLDDLARITRVPSQQIRAAARLIATAGPGIFVSGLGLSEQSQGVAGVMAYCNLGLLTGAIGRRGAGMLPLRGQNNVQGNADMGSQPYALTGYAAPSDSAARARLAQLWGKAPPATAGKTIPEMYDAAVHGSLKGLWIQGEDVVQSDPHQEHVIAALRNLDLLIVQELFMTETARFAHVIFPAASVLEQEGTFTNGERRVQHVRPAVAPPAQARPDWEVIRDVGIAMSAGLPATPWRYARPADVFAEVAACAPDLFGGISYERLGEDGLQWPCPSASHPGTATVHESGFVRGRAAFMSVDYLPPQDATDPGHPIVLMTGRILEHYNVGTMTRRTPNRELEDADYLELHPEDAARLAVTPGSPVRVRSRWGEATAPARISRRVLPGTAFLTFHFPETRTNRLVGPCVDPTSKCPDYKVVAVTLSRE